MNIVYIVGIVMAFFFTVFGIVVGFDMSTLQFSFSIGNLSNFVDLSSILIVIGGTLAVVVACYPKQIRSLPKHFKIMLHSSTGLWHDRNSDRSDQYAEEPGWSGYELPGA